MLSGIGDSHDLNALGIPTAVNLPGVGKNLADHPFLPIQFLVNSTNTLEAIQRNGTLAGQLFTLWDTAKAGPFAGNIVNQLGWFRLPKNAPIFQKYPDPSSGPNSGHFEMLYGVSSNFCGQTHTIYRTLLDL